MGQPGDGRLMDKLEVRLRLFEAAAKAYGGISSIHMDAVGIAKVATDWYNDVVKLEVPDTVDKQAPLGLPKKIPPK